MTAPTVETVDSIAQSLTAQAAPDPTEEAAPDPTPETPEAGTAVEATAPEVPEEDGAPSEEAEEAPDADPEPSHSVDVQLPNVDGKDRGVITLTGLTQEAADTLRFHQKQAALVPKLEEDRASLREQASLVQFIQSSPVEGMIAVAQHQPQAAEAFFDLYARANPQLLQKAAESLGLQLSYGPDVNERVLLSESRAVKLELGQRVQQAQGKVQTLQQVEAFSQLGQDVISQLGDTLSFGDRTPLKAGFKAACEDALVQVYQQNPRATRADVTAALSPIVQSFATTLAVQGQQKAVKVAQAQSQARDVAGQFTKKLERAKTLKKVPGGVAPVSPLGNKPLPPNATLDDIIKAGGAL